MVLGESIYRIQLELRQRSIASFYRIIKRKDKNAEIPANSPSGILFVMTGLLGDSVMSQPALAVARQLWPEARITVLGKTHNRDLLKADPNIDDFYVCDADPFSLRRSAEITKLGLWLAAQKFDIAIILLGDQFAHLLARAGIPVRVGVKGTILEPCLTHAYEIGSPREWGTSERLNCLRVLGKEVPDLLPRLYVDPQAAETAAEKLGELGLGNGEPYIAFHPFGSTKRQWWPMENIREFLRNAKSRTGMRIVLIGGKETKAAETAADRIMMDTRGLLSIPELLAVINGSALVVTTDSGPFHIAGALGKKIIGLFRNRRPEHAYAYPNVLAVFGMNEKCNAECEWDKCAADPCRQMAAISAAAVFFSEGFGKH